MIEFKQNFEKEFKQKLLETTVKFHEYMWDGYSDENDPKFLSQEDYEGIEALVDKIEHMTLNIGCPSSVTPMLQSIVNRKIKHWQGEHMFYGNLYQKGWEKGKQLKTKDNINFIRKHQEYPNSVISGHFRWNNRGYLLSRTATDLIEQIFL